MRPKTLIKTLKTLFPTRRTVAIEGSPGGGKTSICRLVAEQLGIGFIEKHMPTMLVEDFGILFPKENTNKVEYKLPDWFPSADRTDIPDKGILCFDDRNQANADLQKVLANICQARNLHGVPLKEGWQVISTGNRQSDKAGANRVLTHLRNRETVYELLTDMTYWLEWAFEHNVRPEVISFVKFRPNLLHNFDPQKDQNPTPRSWVEGVSDAIGIVPVEAEYDTFKGAVGEEATAEFVGFVKIYRNLPDPEDIIKSPNTAVVPTDPATLYALCGSLANFSTKETFPNVINYMNRVPPEFAVLCMNYVIGKDYTLSECKEYADWATKNQNVILG